jgi:hypothetical protein
MTDRWTGACLEGDMTRSFRRAPFALATLTAIAAIACGASDEDNPFTPPVNQDNTASGGTSSGSSGDFGTSGGASSSSGQTGGDGGACAAVSAPAKLQNVNLVMLLDRSGSMGDSGNGNNNRSTRWTPVTTAIKSFVTDTSVQGMSASLTLFPNSADVCSNTIYSTANAAMGSIPNAAIVATIDGTNPGDGTPLRRGLGGVISQATAYATAHPDEKTVIVVATDGEPTGCDVPNRPTAAQVTAEVNLIGSDVAAVAASTPTYVIGVGSSLTYLNSIAASGGTTAATLVTVGDPAATAAAFLATLNKIRQDSISCDVTIPVPPDGRKLDVNKVSVKSNGTDLTYSADCSVGGWHYDDVNAPTKVILCPSACTQVRQSGKGLDVSFECVNKQVVVPK